MTPGLVVHRLSKAFNGVEVLKSIDLKLNDGEVLGLVGENGAGKSTLMNILGGNLPFDSGSIELRGAVYRPSTSRDAQRFGIGLVHQELNLFPNLSIGENLFLDDMPLQGPFIRKTLLGKRSDALLERVGLHQKSTMLVGRLSMGERQLVELARVLARDSKLLLLDEPTTSLSDRECERFFRLLKDLAVEGRGVLLITHAIGDVIKNCDRVAVLRDGAIVAEGEACGMDSARIVSAMVGRPVNQFFPTRAIWSTKTSVAKPKTDAKVLLRTSKLCQPQILDSVSLELQAGEVLGVYGLMGAGRSELARVLFGLDAYSHGTIEIHGQPMHGGPATRIAQGMALLTESRRYDGICQDASLAENMGLVALRRFVSNRFGMIAGKRLAKAISTMRDAVHLQSRLNDSQRMRTLSGGNQQKALLGKWLLAEPDIFILDEPTRGIDVGAKFEIYQLIHRLADQGSGVLAISSDVDELMGICDRMLVMSLGRVTGDFVRGEWDRDRLMDAALFHHHRDRDADEVQEVQ